MNQHLQPMALLTPGGNISAYIQAVNAFPVLSAKREHDLATELYYRDDINSARELVLAHLRFVVHIARSYSGYGLPLSDLVQEGNVGLMKAVRRFNPEKGVRLVSFAVHWIKAEKLALGQGRHDQGATQAVLQSAQFEEKPRLAQQRGS